MPDAAVETAEAARPIRLSGFWNLTSGDIIFPIKFAFHADGTGYEIRKGGGTIQGHFFYGGQKIPIVWQQKGNELVVNYAFLPPDQHVPAWNTLTWHGPDSFTKTTQGSGNKGVYVRAN